MKRPADSGSYLPKLCWIRRRFKWLLGESTDDGVEAGSCDVNVWCDRSVATSCMHAGLQVYRCRRPAASRPHSSLDYQTPAEFAAGWGNEKYEEKPTDITN